MKRITAMLVFACAAPLALGQVSVQEPWVRGTVATQKVTGAFMALRAERDARLVDVRSPVAGKVEIHESTMQGGVMRMRPVQRIELPAGRTVELRPGGYHVMLLDLKAQLKAGDKVPLTLVVEGADGKRQDIDVQATVRPLGAPAAKGHGDHGHGKGH